MRREKKTLFNATYNKTIDSSQYTCRRWSAFELIDFDYTNPFKTSTNS